MPLTRQHNLRVLVKLNHVNVPRCKWHIALKRDATGPLGGCQRFIVEDRLAAGDHLVRRPLAQQGVCTSFRDSSNNIVMSNLANIDWNAYIGQWICLEHEANLDTGLYSVYVTTPDGAAVDALWSQVNIANGSPGNPANLANLYETVPGTAQFYSFDGIFFDNPDTGGHGAYVCSGIVSNTHIGPPQGFVTNGTQPMQIAVTVQGVCPGGNHVHLSLTVGGQTRQRTISRDDLTFEPSEYDTVIATLLRSRVKEAGATTNAQIQAAIESKPFYL
jgi:hypothetical protein